MDKNIEKYLETHKEKSLINNWKKFLLLVCDPTNLLLIIGSVGVCCFTTMKSGNPEVEGIIAFFSILLSVLTGFLGARIDRGIVSVETDSRLETRGLSAIRDLDMISRHIYELYDRISKREKRKLIEKAINENLQVVQYSDHTLEDLLHLSLIKRMIYKSMKDWIEIVPKRVYETLTNEYDSIKREKFEEDNHKLESIAQWKQEYPDKSNPQETEDAAVGTFGYENIPVLDGRNIKFDITSGSPTTDILNLVREETLRLLPDPNTAKLRGVAKYVFQENEPNSVKEFLQLVNQHGGGSLTRAEGIALINDLKYYESLDANLHIPNISDNDQLIYNS